VLAVLSLPTIQRTQAIEALTQSFEDITRRKEWLLYKFQGEEHYYQLNFMFAVNGSLCVWDNYGSEMQISIPQFSLAETSVLHTSLFFNSTHVLQKYDLKTPSDLLVLNVNVFYDLEILEKGVKITMSGSGLAPVVLKLHFKSNLEVELGDNLVHAGVLTYDWNDAISVSNYDHVEEKLSLSLERNFYIDPSLISTVSATSAIRESCQRKSFYGSGRYWVFYSTGTNLVYRTSTDGETWTSETTVRASANGYYFSIWYNGTAVSYVHATGLSNIVYRCGTTQTDGTISWLTSEQTITSGAKVGTPTISIDSSGYPWVGYDNGTASDTKEPYVLKSSLNNGTWSTASGFPYKLRSGTAMGWSVFPNPATSSKIYAVYVEAYTAIAYGKMWSGSWGSEESVFSGGSSRMEWSSIATDDDMVHVVYRKAGTYKIAYRERSVAGVWSSEETVTDSSAYSPQITKDENDTYIFYGVGSKIKAEARYSDGTSSDVEISGSYGTNVRWISSYSQIFNSENAIVFMHDAPYELYWTIPSFGSPWVEPEPPSGGAPYEPEVTDELDVVPPPPKITIPIWGYYVIFGSVGIVIVGSLLANKKPSRRKVRGVKRKSVDRTPRNLKPRPTKLHKRSRKTGRFSKR